MPFLCHFIRLIKWALVLEIECGTLDFCEINILEKKKWFLDSAVKIFLSSIIVFFPQQESCQMKALYDIMMMIMEMVITMMGHWISRRKQTVSLVGEGCWCPMVLHACPIAPPSILILFHPPHCDPLHPHHPLQSMHLHNRHILAFPLSLDHLPGPGWSKSKEKVNFLRHEGGRWLKENNHIWN